MKEDEPRIKRAAKTPLESMEDDMLRVGPYGCHGDSGGPLIHSETGEVVGVLSHGTLGRGFGGIFYASVYPHLDLIDRVVREAGGCLEGDTERCDGIDNDCDGVIDEDCAELGSACATDDECLSRLCVPSDGEGICTRRCTPDSSDRICPRGFECTPDTFLGLCTPRIANDGLADEAAPEPETVDPETPPIEPARSPAPGARCSILLGHNEPPFLLPPPAVVLLLWRPKRRGR